MRNYNRSRALIAFPPGFKTHQVLSKEDNIHARSEDGEFEN